MANVDQTTLSNSWTAYFFLGRDGHGNFHGYSHQAIVLAEGLKQLGWRIASDVEFWRPEPDAPFLFPGDLDGPVPKDCDLLVIGDDFFILQGNPTLPKAVMSCDVPAIYLDRRDLSPESHDIYGKDFSRLQAIFRTHGNERFRYPKNVRHMVFGLSNRIAQASLAAASEVGQQPRSGLAWNFRHKQFPHTVRLWVEKEFRPLIEANVPLQAEIDPEVPGNEYSSMMLKQTEGRHFPAYFQRMACAEVAACFGGWFLLPMRQEEAGPVCMWGRRLMRTLKRPTSMIAQWDSWRMWEAFAAGTAVLQVDMTKTGFLFGGPRPEPMKHYIPLQLDRPAKELLPLLQDTDRTRKIGEAGRAWALEHYSSMPIATRILNEIGIA